MIDIFPWSLPSPKNGTFARETRHFKRTILVALGRDRGPEVVRIHDDVNARVERRGKVGCKK